MPTLVLRRPERELPALRSPARVFADQRRTSRRDEDVGVVMAIDCLKLGLPVALLLWLALKPARGWLAYVVQASSIGAVLLALALAVTWLVPPWPTPFVLASAFVAIVALRLRAVRRAAAPAWGVGRAATGALGLLALLGTMAIYVSAAALLGRIPPQSDVARISSPIPAGRYLVASGGSSLWVN